MRILLLILLSFNAICQVPIGTPINGNHSLANGLVCWYPLNEGAGNFAFDYSGNNYRASLINGTTYKPSAKGVVAYFDGVNDYISKTMNSKIDMTGKTAISFGGWFYTQKTSTYQLLIGNVQNTSVRQYAVYLTASNTSQMYIALSGVSLFGPAGTNVTLSTAWQTNTWQHIIVTYSGAKVTVYLNGKVVATSNQTGTITYQNAELNIGMEKGLNYGLQGSSTMCGVWSRCLTYDEVNCLFTDINCIYK